MARGGWAGVRQERKRDRVTHACFGKWFTRNFFVNRFPIFSKGFSGQRQIIYVDFYFTVKQAPANDENVFRKMFYVDTNGT